MENLIKAWAIHTLPYYGLLVLRLIQVNHRLATPNCLSHPTFLHSNTLLVKPENNTVLH